MNKNISQNEDDYDLQQIKNYMQLPLEEKLELLERYRLFTSKFMSEQSQRARERLREQGY